MKTHAMTGLTTRYLNLKIIRRMKMIRKYKRYKNWWLKYQAPYKVGNSDEAFEAHINLMSTYELMETLINWE
jgi:hypothetical protein